MTCQAAHPDDTRSCSGATDAVILIDPTGTQSTGCVRHAAAALASVTDLRVSPGPGDTGSNAIAAYRRARQLRPFDFTTDPGD